VQQHELVAAVAGSAAIRPATLAAQLPPDYTDLLGTEPVRHH
jgi:hypothetical protein